MPQFEGKRILVTGACGTVGTELVHQLLTDPGYAPEEVIGIDNNESDLFFLDQAYLNEPRARFFVADVRDRDELSRRMSGVDLVFHAAALKHVILSERSPDQAVQTNITGVQNVIAAATENGVGRVIFTSSDKAVNPTNVMGTSKLMGERLMTAANSSKRFDGPIFASTRFGNVLGSRGSVIPIFHNQIAAGGPVTLTDPDMTRFVMSIEDSVRLVLDSAALAQGGEVFITKMPVVRIADLATAMIRSLAPRYGFGPDAIETQVIGTKPGEKLYEELMSDEETRRSVELPRYFAVLPAFRGIYHDIPYDYPEVVTEEVTNPYVSAREPAESPDWIQGFLERNGLLGEPEEETARRYWPGDKEERN
ncbi:capsule biosynthesis protein CapD [Thiohalorhabdus denitrificans]|uniref:Polysaccharide biosynthesis protein n=1 Tax=Thiohalorhabdus denitrificans TaxID=381306 RepID=A0A0P9CQS2_9GAMM|nr:SDR family NAD(P)-dependent oxidoreductase [Thiohalorhabdus denitrificans]KPV39042.1 capsule biosynthesis protein CapD [Thiohalorhabdus denitrificans]SCX79153.1 Polysaccharide biosynthesis protein [Thiohalorhabdus denitrificans]